MTRPIAATRRRIPSARARRALAAVLVATIAMHAADPPTPRPLLAQDGPALAMAGQLGGPVQAVAVDAAGQTFVGVGPRVIVFTMCGSEWPVERGRTAPLPGLVEDIQLRDGLAYVAAGVGGLVVLDARDPAGLRVLGRAPLEGVAAKVVLDGPRAFVAAGARGLRIVDVADPAAPREIGVYQAIVTDFTLVGTRAYVVARNLQQVDVSNPAAPRIERTLEDWSDAVDSIGPHVFVAISTAVPGESRRVGSLRVYDVTNTRRPAIVHTLPIGDQARALVRVGGHVLYQGASRLTVVAQAVPASLGPVLGAIGTPDSVQAVLPAGRTAYLAAGRAGLRAVADWPAPAAARERQVLDTLGSAESVAVADGFAYVEDEGSGNRVLVVDVRRPAEPRVVAAIPVGVDHGAMVADGGRLFVGAPDRTVRIFDVRDPAAPRPLAQVAMPRDPVTGREAPVWRLALDADWLYVANDEWLRVLDVADPAAPREVSRRRSSGGATDLAARDRRAYVLGPSTGTFQGRPSLQIIDVFRPDDPLQLGTHPVTGAQGGVQTDGSHVFVEGVQVVDVRNPERPVDAAALTLPGRNRASALAGTRLYLARTNADIGGSVRVVDVTAPSSPIAGPVIELVEGVRGIAVRDGHAFAAAQGLGLVVVRDAALPLPPTPAPTAIPTRVPGLSETTYLPLALRGPLGGVCR